MTGAVLEIQDRPTGVTMLRLLPLLALIAVVVFFVVSALQRRGSGGARPSRRGPVAPDDDPSFLRDLDDKLWRDRRRRRRGQPEESDDGQDESGAA